MRTLWILLGALAVVQAVPSALSLERGQGVVYENEGFRWQLDGLGLLLSSGWLDPGALGNTVTEGVRGPFRRVLEVAERPVYAGFDGLLRRRGTSRHDPMLQWEVWICESLIYALLAAVLMALALQRIVAELRGEGPSRHGFWRSAVGNLGPLFVLGAILVVINGVSLLSRPLLRAAFSTADGTDLNLWRQSVVHVIAFPLALTPFLIVGRRVGILAGIAASFRLTALAWRELLVVLGLYRAGFLLVGLVGRRMVWFISEICLLPPHLMRLHVPALESMRHAIISGVSLATIVGWLAQIVGYWASSGLDLLLCCTLMLLVLRTSAQRAAQAS
jgi:hypothetical protein